MRASSSLQKIMVIVGQTASGKSALAVSLALRFNGEVISADSRQVYRGLDIGADKITREEMRGVRHHLIDNVDPAETYTAADFLRDADAAIAEIAARGRLPIIAGGTLFYIDALLGVISLADAPADAALREELTVLSTEKLFEKLREQDPAYAERVDRPTAGRPMRAGHKPPPPPGPPRGRVIRQSYNALLIGLSIPPAILRERIAARARETLAAGLVVETNALLASGLSEARLREIGLEYRVVLASLRDELSTDDLPRVLTEKVWQYAKRQRTWLRKMQNIHWIPHDEPEHAYALVDEFCGR